MAEQGEESDSDEEEQVLEQEEEEMEEESRPIKRKLGFFTGGAGAWDEFLDDDTVPTTTTTTTTTKIQKQSFDIYVKPFYLPLPLSSRPTSLPRPRMFPVPERKRRVDAYGEAIDVEGWLRRGLEGEEMNVLGRDVRVGAGGAVASFEKRETEEFDPVSPLPPPLLVFDKRDNEVLMRCRSHWRILRINL